VPLVRLLGLSLFGFAHGVVIGAPAGKPFS
jgi:hypothetical protein